MTTSATMVRLLRRRNRWGMREPALVGFIEHGFPQKVVDLSAIRGSESNSFAMYLRVTRARTMNRHLNCHVPNRFKRSTRP